MSYADPSLASPPVFEADSQDRQWAMLAHLSGVVAMWLGWLGFLGPLVVWLIKKDQSRFVDDQGKEALNFQLTMLLAGFALGILTVPVTLLTVGIGILLMIPLYIALFVLAIVMPILAAIKANAGEAYRYPYILRIVT